MFCPFFVSQTCNFHISRRQFSEQAQLDPTVEEIITKIQSLNLLQVSELVTHLKSRLNIPDSALMGGGQMMVAAAPAADEGAAPAVEEQEAEKTIFNVKMDKYDDKKKIAVIKEAKALVESTPCTLGEDIPKVDAEAWMEKLKAV